eukprot:UN11756
MVKRFLLLIFFPKVSYLFLQTYTEPLYLMKKRVNKNIKTMIKYRNTNPDLLPKNVEDKTFMDHARLLVENDPEYNESQEIADIFLMFLAGTDTTSITVEWGLLLLAKQPNVQNKVRNELVNVLNKNNIDFKTDSMNVVYDINLLLRLPLFRACIHEILRISCVARDGVEHSLKQDVWVKSKNGKEYRLPAGCGIRYNGEAIP